MIYVNTRTSHYFNILTIWFEVNLVFYRFMFFKFSLFFQYKYHWLLRKGLYLLQLHSNVKPIHVEITGCVLQTYSRIIVSVQMIRKMTMTLREQGATQVSKVIFVNIFFTYLTSCIFCWVMLCACRPHFCVAWKGDI